MSMASGILYPCDFQVDGVSISCTGPKTILGRLFFYHIRLVLDNERSEFITEHNNYNVTFLLSSVI